MKQHAPTPLVAEAARLLNSGQLGPAAEAARRALAIKPTDADALGIMGVIEAHHGRFDSAVRLLRKVVDLRPKDATAHSNLARALQQAGDGTAAEKSCRDALRLNPKSALLHNNLGVLQLEGGDAAAALQSFQKAMAGDAAFETAVFNIYAAGRVLGAMAAVESAAATAAKRWPSNPMHRLYRAEALFVLGRLEEAWACYAWRFKATQHPVVSRAVPGVREWQGEPTADKSVLVWTEQGPGDEAMYTTMLPDVRARVGQLAILCSSRIAPLLRRTYPDLTVYGDVVPTDAAQRFDMQAPLVAFAATVRPDLAHFPVRTQRLVPDAGKVAELRSRYKNGSDKLLVGVSWRSKDVQDAGQKSVSLGVWGPLFALPGVQFVNLQYGDCAREIAAIKTEFGATVIHDATIDPLGDLDAYAAQVAAMDVVVSSSNTAAHIAGALGVATHCMVAATPGRGRRWYWFERDGRSVWYDSVTLWTQGTPGSWDDVICAVTLTLARALYERGLNDEIPGFLERLANGYRQAGGGAQLGSLLRAWAEIPGQAARAAFEQGILAKGEGRIDEAVAAFDRAATLDPSFASALNMKGVVLASQQRWAEAEASYRAAIAAAPAMYEAHVNFGTLLRRIGRGAEADTQFRQADALKPGVPQILQAIAANLNEMGRTEALTYFDRVLELQPQHAEAHYGRGMALLSAGRLAEGWPELLWRRHLPLAEGEKQSLLFDAERELPRWAGQDVSGKAVLVLAEHGLGDQIMTFSIVPDLIAAGAKTSLICTPRLVALFRRSFPEAVVHDEQSWTGTSLTDFDYQMSLSELGARFRPTVEAFGRKKSFLVADDARRMTLRERYGANARRVIGVSWASRNPEIGGLKTLGLTRIMQALSGQAGAAFVNLQYGDYATDVAAAQAATGLTLITDGSVDAVGDLDGFAAQVASMDAVVTISNTTAHMAGALGVPTFLLLPHARGRHWYWMRGPAHCPWYPSVRYFTQDADGSWGRALEDMRRALD